eukprot:2251159-Amphidinium_carterae.1
MAGNWPGRNVTLARTTLALLEDAMASKDVQGCESWGRAGKELALEADKVCRNPHVSCTRTTN